MRQFVSSQYEAIVGEHIAPRDTAIVRPPKSIDVTYNVAGHFTHLRAAGDIQIHNERGDAFSGWYDIRWYQHGDARLNESDTPWVLEQAAVATR